MSLIWVGAMCREVFWVITEMHKKKEQQQNLRVGTNFHLGGGSYCDSEPPRTLYEITTLYDFTTLPCL